MQVFWQTEVLSKVSRKPIRFDTTHCSIWSERRTPNLAPRCASRLPSCDPRSSYGLWCPGNGCGCGCLWYSVLIVVLAVLLLLLLLLLLLWLWWWWWWWWCQSQYFIFFLQHFTNLFENQGDSRTINHLKKKQSFHIDWSLLVHSGINYHSWLENPPFWW